MSYHRLEDELTECKAAVDQFRALQAYLGRAAARLTDPAAREEMTSAIAMLDDVLHDTCQLGVALVESRMEDGEDYVTPAHARWAEAR